MTVLLGIDPRTGRRVHQVVPQHKVHTLKVGKSGSGKSVAEAARWTAIAREGSVNWLQLDPKDDIGPLTTRLMAAAGLENNVVQINFFSGAAVPLNPLWPQEGLEAAVQARIAARHFEGLIGERLGPRMLRVFLRFAEALIGVKGHLMDMARMLESPAYRRRVAARCAKPEVRRFLEGGIEDEPPASLAALANRLDLPLSLPAARRVLCARGCLTATRLFSGRAIINTGGAPAGAGPLAAFFAGLVFDLVLVPGLFARPVGTERHLAVVIDELPEVLRAADPDQLERLSSLVRARNVSLHLMLQDMAQLDRASPGLARIVQTNARQVSLYEPSTEQLARHLGHRAPSPTLRDPNRPSRTLSAAEARMAWCRWVASLGPRHFVHDSHRGIQVLRTPNVPLPEVERRWAALSAEQRLAWTHGALKHPMGEPTLTLPDPPDAAPGSRPRARPRLVLP